MDEQINNTNVSEIDYFNTLLHAVNQLHIDHFQANAYGKHIALEEAYTGLNNFLDELIEVRQGESETLVKGYKSLPFVDFQDSISYLEKVIRLSKEYREDKSTNVQNLIDEIISLLEKTIYKLTFLK